MTFNKRIKLLLLWFVVVFLLYLSSTCFGQSISPNIDCHNEEIMSFDKAIIFAPHLDDEVLGFAGVIYEALQKKKEIKIVIVTDGAAYIQACYLWKNGCPQDSCGGSPCDKSDFDLFGQQRIKESLTALALLGVDSSMVEVLGYPDGCLKQMYDSLEIEIPANGTTRVSAGHVLRIAKTFACNSSLLQVFMFE